MTHSEFSRPSALPWLEPAVLTLIAAVYVLWLLSLPVFPTQDGPVHLFYTHVMLALFSKNPGVYGHFYTIKHLVPPYSAYYYLLMFLSTTVGRLVPGAVPLFLADKLIISGYILSFIFGFRYLARAIGPAADQATLLATLLLLNWPLGMGFVNFCVGLSLSLWTLGVWLRTVGRPGLARKALFVALCIALVFAHPIPLLAVLGYGTVDLAARWLLSRGSTTGRPAWPDALALLLAMATLAYIKHFTIANVTQQMLPEPGSPLSHILHNVLQYGEGRGISFFSGFIHEATWPTRVYRFLLIAIVPVSLVFGLLQLRRNRARPGSPSRTFRPATLWLVLTLLMIVVQPLVPHDMNASHYFADRLLLFIWIGALLTLSGAAPMSTPARAAFVFVAVLGVAVTLPTADTPLRAAAAQMLAIERSPILHRGQVGVTLLDPRTPPDSTTGLAYNPLFWAGVNDFRHNDAILYDTPWLDLTVIPLGARQGLATAELPSTALEDPQNLRRLMAASPTTNALVLSRVGFVLINHYDRLELTTPDPQLAADPDHAWTCPAGDKQPWFLICDRTTPLTPPYR